MTDQPENPPVFPNVLTLGNKSMSDGGLHLRDLFAAAALTGLGTWQPDFIPLISSKALESRAKWAYQRADAMLRERGK